ncbi:hypothetical protein SBOR_5953 [Sclerotinia borealis F-4128]|uniref:Uncharacterized protein n=1 Tax=Sclerotinia borealis (strain F-4128) TaxID=1432307 RepID=W9CCU3_SCLBF|nr:hypothetical protein SBOR_5953 [Sclerotinia borealis F-4128]
MIRRVQRGELFFQHRGAEVKACFSFSSAIATTKTPAVLSKATPSASTQTSIPVSVNDNNNIIHAIGTAIGTVIDNVENLTSCEDWPSFPYGIHGVVFDVVIQAYTEMLGKALESVSK